MDTLRRIVGYTPKETAPPVFKIDILPFTVYISNDTITLQCQGTPYPLHAIMERLSIRFIDTVDNELAFIRIYGRLSETYLKARSTHKETSINDLGVICRMGIEKEINKDGFQVKLTIHFRHETFYLYFDDPRGIKYTPITETIDDHAFSFSRRQITTPGWSLQWGNIEKYKPGAEKSYEKTIDRNVIIDEIYFALNTKTAESKLRTVRSKEAKVIDEMDLYLTFTINVHDNDTYKITLGFLERGDDNDWFNPIRNEMDKRDPLNRKWRFDVTTRSEITRGFGRISESEYKYIFEIKKIMTDPQPSHKLRFINVEDANKLDEIRGIHRWWEHYSLCSKDLTEILDFYFQ
jgi:hypothetical protein